MLNMNMKLELLAILREELIPARGCTEPIALAYAAAKARSILGAEPDRIIARCSGNIVKNVRSVTIPNSGGMTGIEASVALGALGGDAELGLEVLESLNAETRRDAQAFADNGKCSVEFLDSEIPLHFIIEEISGPDHVTIEVRHSHTHIHSIQKNGTVLYKAEEQHSEGSMPAGQSALNLENIRKFADEIEIDEIKPIYDRLIQYNMAIAEEGLSGRYGVGIGKTIRSIYEDSAVTRMKAYASAASEARMCGCDLPVIITSGSGNQGIASSVPVIVYAHEKGIPQEKLYRALAFSSLLTVYQKEFIGKLSAFCGAVSASCAAGTAITYLNNGTMKQITDTIDNTLANIPGIICDGAKASCAAKIATSLDAALMAHSLAMQDKAYEALTGILKEDIGETIGCVGYIGKVGMKQTDKEIIRVMLAEDCPQKGEPTAHQS